MKDLKNLKGAKKLSKNEQRSIKGGIDICDIYGHDCPEGYVCQWRNRTTGWCIPYIED